MTCYIRRHHDFPNDPRPVAPAGRPAPGRRVSVDALDLAQALARGERRALARAITLAESTRADHRAVAEDLIARVLPLSGRAFRVGVSGAPGVGKSTFIEAFGGHLTGLGHRVAVLAVDPSSRLGGGSILGDKTRMERLARDERAFIRPSPSGGTLGGVARRTREAIILVEAAGFDVVLVETVGVGQSEVAVADMTDLFMLLAGPGGGDELQGIKRGIMELADLILVTKADGALAGPANIAASELISAIHLLRPRCAAWSTRVILTSALSGLGLDAVWQAVRDHRAALSASGDLEATRSAQAKAALWREVEAAILDAFLARPGMAQAMEAMEAEVAAGRLSPAGAARRLLSR